MSNLPLPFVVAEICGNHGGNLGTAKRMIEAAAQSGASYAKFQKRRPVESLSIEQYDSPHPVPANSFGDTYGAHREALEFKIKAHVELYDCCRYWGIGYATSVWDMTSAREVIEHINPDYIKVPSACNTNLQLLAYLRDEFDGEVHVSTGMTTYEEVESIHKIFERKLDRLVLYACTSGYPVPHDKVYLREIESLKWMPRGGERAHLGFSGHHLGTALDIAAYVLGATWIERHFTLDKTAKGTDHACSLLPEELRKLVDDLEAVRAAMKYKPQEMDPIEVEQRVKLKSRA